MFMMVGHEGHHMVENLAYVASNASLRDPGIIKPLMQGPITEQNSISRILNRPNDMEPVNTHTSTSHRTMVAREHDNFAKRCSSKPFNI
jgi:hypothetical protein